MYIHLIFLIFFHSVKHSWPAGRVSFPAWHCELTHNWLCRSPVSSSNVPVMFLINCHMYISRLTWHAHHLQSVYGMAIDQCFFQWLFSPKEQEIVRLVPDILSVLIISLKWSLSTKRGFANVFEEKIFILFSMPRGGSLRSVFSLQCTPLVLLLFLNKIVTKFWSTWITMGLITTLLFTQLFTLKDGHDG